MTQTATLLRSAKKIVITAMSASLFASIPLQCFLCSLGFDAVSIEAGELLHHVSGAWKDAMVIMVSLSGESVEIARLLERMKNAVPIIDITNVPLSQLSRSANVSLSIASLNDEMVAISDLYRYASHTAPVRKHGCQLVRRRRGRDSQSPPFVHFSGQDQHGHPPGMGRVFHIHLRNLSPSARSERTYSEMYACCNGGSAK
jgi:hypothetical protein